VATYRIHKGSLNEKFLASRAKVQAFCGGFANGKTASACIRAIELSRDYPGSNGLIARSTYPKLNDTIRKEFLKWCPNDWIKSFPRSANSSNTCTLTNGTTINFRYIQQQGKSGQESTTSNLLSATYDWIIVDQIEDPEIVHKDFTDLLGRLRGSTPYEGEDPTMPETGPRWFIFTSNPTRNWVYRKLIKPIHDFMDKDPVTDEPKNRHVNDDLLCVVDEDGKTIRDADNLPIPLIELYEGSTYTNKENLPADYIRGLESSYKGMMRTRFLMGEWSSYEGLVYPAFSEMTHVMSHHTIEHYYRQLQISSKLEYLEGYDYGLAVPFCYMLGFTDNHGNVFLMDGAYNAEFPLGDHIGGDDSDERGILDIRKEYGVPPRNHILADPDIFRRKSIGSKKLVGKSISDMLLEDGILCERGNNDITNGIVKVNQYLIPQRNHQNPITGEYGAPYLYVSDKLEWWIDEISDYYWKKNPTGEQLDVPIDKNDHAMDTTKYILSHRPNISKLLVATKPKEVGWLQWGERDIEETRRDYRHG